MCIFAFAIIVFVRSLNLYVVLLSFASDMQLKISCLSSASVSSSLNVKRSDKENAPHFKCLEKRREKCATFEVSRKAFTF